MSCILAIDDRPINLQFLSSLLGYGGHKVLEACDGEAAFEILDHAHPDLVITDIKMPRMDGFQFVERLRQSSVTADIPVIFYTASYHEAESGGMAGKHGVTDVITKPAKPEDILRKVNLALDGKNRSAAGRPQLAVEPELDQLRATGLKLSALVELGMELGSERDEKKLLSRCCSTARHIIGARKSMLGILTEDHSELRHFLINGLKSAQPVIHDRPPVHHSVLDSIVNERKPVRIDHAAVVTHLEELSPYNSAIRSLLGVPVMSATEVYGWLIMLEKDNGEAFSEEDERIATTLAAQAAIAYENAQFSEKLTAHAEELDQTRRQQLELKDQFISHVSHELRSPLAALHQFTTIVLDGLAGEINSEQREYLEIVLKNSLQLRDMIGDLLEVTRTGSGKLSLNRKSVSVCELLRHTSRIYEKRIADKGLDFIVPCSSCPGKQTYVYIDPNRIEQVLSNLLDNALKFTETGSIAISCAQPDNKAVRISVKDTGAGIGRECLNLVFDRLYQSPNTLDASRKGLGLGLHICRTLIEMHGGEIWVESEPGAGSTFFFTIPVTTIK